MSPILSTPPNHSGLFSLNTEISVSILVHSLIRATLSNIQIQQTDLAYRLLSLHSVKACEDFYRRINKSLSGRTRAAPVCARASRRPPTTCKCATLSARSPAVEYAGPVVVRERERGNCFTGPRHTASVTDLLNFVTGRKSIICAAGQRISKFA